MRLGETLRGAGAAVGVRLPRRAPARRAAASLGLPESKGGKRGEGASTSTAALVREPLPGSGLELYVSSISNKCLFTRGRRSNNRSHVIDKRRTNKKSFCLGQGSPLPAAQALCCHFSILDIDREMDPRHKDRGRFSNDCQRVYVYMIVCVYIYVHTYELTN